MACIESLAHKPMIFDGAPEPTPVPVLTATNHFLEVMGEDTARNLSDYGTVVLTEPVVAVPGQWTRTPDEVAKTEPAEAVETINRAFAALRGRTALEGPAVTFMNLTLADGEEHLVLVGLPDA